MTNFYITAKIEIFDEKRFYRPEKFCISPKILYSFIFLEFFFIYGSTKKVIIIGDFNKSKIESLTLNYHMLQTSN